MHKFLACACKSQDFAQSTSGSIWRVYILNQPFVAEKTIQLGLILPSGRSQGLPYKQLCQMVLSIFIYSAYYFRFITFKFILIALCIFFYFQPPLIGFLDKLACTVKYCVSTLKDEYIYFDYMTFTFNASFVLLVIMPGPI